MPHSLISPSALKRTLTCHPSLLAPEGKSSKYSAEGSVAHGVADSYFESGQWASPGDIIEHEGFAITVTQEMLDYVRVYTDYVDGLSLIYDEHKTETRIIHSRMPDFGGTIDCQFVGPGIHIVDLKYGAGVMVDVEENEQLGAYALLTLDSLGLPIQDVQATVVQPRCHDGRDQIQETTLSRAWLLDLWNRIIRLRSMPSNEYHAGEHCQFCPLKPKCRELHKLALVAAKDDFSDAMFDGQDEDTARAIWVLENAGAIEAYIAAVKSWAYHHIVGGGKIDGYKLVETFTNRVFAVGPEKILSEVRKLGFGVGKKQIYKSTLLPPAQLEKIIGKSLVNQFTKRVSKGAAMVPQDDRRPEFIVKHGQEFESIELEEGEFHCE